MTTAQEQRFWVAIGPAGTVASIREEHHEAFEVRMTGSDDVVGTYPSLEIAKRAIQGRMSPGADRPRFERR